MNHLYFFVKTNDNSTSEPVTNHFLTDMTQILFALDIKTEEVKRIKLHSYQFRNILKC